MINKYLLYTVFLVFTCVCLFASCEKPTDLSNNYLIGDWESTRVDSIYQFIVPENPDILVTCEYMGVILEVRDGGSFEMLTSSDTITGSWSQTVPDSLKLITTNDKVYGNFKMDCVGADELILEISGGFVKCALDVGYSESRITEHIVYHAKVYYRRKSVMQ